MSAALLPPGPKGRLLRGNLPEFTRDRLGFFLDCARYGDIVSYRLGPRRCLQLNHPDHIEYVLVSGSRNFTKHFVLRLNRLLLGNGLLTSEGGFWLRQRRLAQPAFLRDRIAAYGPIMAAATERLLAGWKEGEIRDIHAEMMQFTLEIAAETLFGADVRAEAREVGSLMAMAIAGYLARMKTLFMLPMWIPTPTHRRLHHVKRRLDEILYGIINQRRANGRKGDDLLSLLLQARDVDDGTGMTDQQLRDEAMTLFLAGHETTALALAWAWYALAQHPEVEARLVAEIQRTLNGRLPTVADLPKLQYTERFVQEVLRLYPPIYTIGREAVQDCEIGGYKVSAGTTLLMSQWVMQRDPRYFTEPDVFNPDRWEKDLVRRLPRYVYFPFGAGPRVCIGNTFATMEAMLVLAVIAPRFRFTLLPGHPVQPRGHLTLRPEKGIKFVVARR